MKFIKELLQEGRSLLFTKEEAKDVRRFLSGEIDFTEMKESAWDKLYELLLHEMPYGVAKARTGDPDQWMIDHFDHLGPVMTNAFIDNNTEELAK